MCLQIDDDRLDELPAARKRKHYFYKFYALEDGYFAAPFTYTYPPANGRLVAKHTNGKVVDPSGAKRLKQLKRSAYSWHYVEGGAIHAFEDRQQAKEFAETNRGIVVMVEVQGKHIIAFGTCGEVCFTRGKIVDWYLDRYDD